MKHLILAVLIFSLSACGSKGGGSSDSYAAPVTPNNPSLTQPSLPVTSSLAGTYTRLFNMAVYDFHSSSTWVSTVNPPVQCPADTFSSIVINSDGSVSSVTAWDGTPASTTLVEQLSIGDMPAGLLLNNEYDISTGNKLIEYEGTACELVYTYTP